MQSNSSNQKINIEEVKRQQQQELKAHRKQSEQKNDLLLQIIRVECGNEL